VLLSPHAAPSGRPGAPPQAKDAPLLPEDPLSLVVAHLTARGVQRREHGPTWAQRVKQRVSAIRDSVRGLAAALALVYLAAVSDPGRVSARGMHALDPCHGSP
jgi:hypothetical protein